MIMNYLKTLLFVSLIAVFTFACGDGKSTDEDDNDEIDEEKIEVSNAPDNVIAVCLWSTVSLRETPGLKGKYKNTIYLGEKAVYLGETVTDSTDKKNARDFIKVKLTDGTEGWVQANMMAVDAKPFVLREKTKLYKRPDILSAGKDEFDVMQFVVILEEQGEWVKIKGKKRTDGWFKDGWIKMDKLVGNEIDVTVAILTERALLKENNEKKLEALMEITSNTDFSSSIFINQVQSLVEEYNTPEEPEEEYIEGD